MYKAAVHVDLERLYDVGIMRGMEDEGHAILVCFREPELFVEGLIAESVLIQRRTVLILDGQQEFVAFRIGVRYVEDDHVFLRAEVLYCSMFVLAVPGGGLLGVRCCKCHHEESSKEELAEDSVE